MARKIQSCQLTNKRVSQIGPERPLLREGGEATCAPWADGDLTFREWDFAVRVRDWATTLVFAPTDFAVMDFAATGFVPAD